MRKSIVLLALALFLILNVTMCLTGCGGNPSAVHSTRLDFSGVTGLLNVLKATVEASPDCASMTARLAALSGPQRDSLIDSLVRVKAANSRLVAQIDALLDSPAYELYYDQFGNITQDVHRRILLAIPYYAVPSPADISNNLLEVSHHLATLSSWVDSLVPRIDKDSCRHMAMRWLPPGDYETPLTYFICDGNGGAFALRGKVCLDLYSMLLRPRPDDTRYDSLGNSTVDVLQRVIAHEYHHIFAERFYSEYPIESSDWRTTWYNKLVRRMVSEGTAMQCNPPEKFNRAIMEDTATVAAWISSLRLELAGIRNDQMDEKAAEAWMDATYFDSAMPLLRIYLKGTFQGDELDRQVSAHAVDRPSLAYTLGWWMVSRISHEGTDPEAVRELVVHPMSLVQTYNALIPPGADSLRFPERL